MCDNECPTCGAKSGRMKEPGFGRMVKASIKPYPDHKFPFVRTHMRLSIWVDGSGVQYCWDDLIKPEAYTPKP